MSALLRDIIPTAHITINGHIIKCITESLSYSFYTEYAVFDRPLYTFCAFCDSCFAKNKMFVSIYSDIICDAADKNICWSCTLSLTKIKLILTKQLSVQESWFIKLYGKTRFIFDHVVKCNELYDKVPLLSYALATNVPRDICRIILHIYFEIL